MSSSLDKALSDFYADHVLRSEPKNLAAVKLSETLKDPSIREQAKNRLNELEKLNNSSGGNLNKRCYISHIHMIALQETLNG